MKYDKGLEPLSTLNSTLFEKYRVAYYYAKADELGRKNMQPAYDALEELENCKDEIYRYKVKFIQENSDSPGLPDGEPQVLKGEGRVTDVFHQSFYNATGDYYSYPQNY